MIEVKFEEFKCFETIGVGCKEATENILHKGVGKDRWRNALEKGRLKGLIRKWMVVNNSDNLGDVRIGFYG